MGIDDDDDNVGEVGRVGSLIGWLVGTGLDECRKATQYSKART